MPLQQIGNKTAAPALRQSSAAGARIAEAARQPLTYRIADLQPRPQNQPQPKRVTAVGKQKVKVPVDFNRPKANVPQQPSDPGPDVKVRVADPDKPEEGPYKDVGVPTPARADSQEEEQPQEEQRIVEEQQQEPAYTDDAQAEPGIAQTPFRWVGFGNENVGIHYLSSHVAKGCLNTIGICRTAKGYHPVATSVPIGVSDMRGSVDFGIDVVNPKLEQRFLQSVNALTANAAGQDLKQATEGLVVRARQGDQNAMALIALVRENAKKGQAQARKAFAMLKDYISKNPPGNSGINGEPAQATIAARDPRAWGPIWFANGPDLTNSTIRDIVSTFEDGNEARTFLFGVVDYKSVIPRELARFGVAERQLLEIGASIGEARAIQKVRLPNSSISEFDAVIGWELGE